MNQWFPYLFINFFLFLSYSSFGLEAEYFRAATQNLIFFFSFIFYFCYFSFFIIYSILNEWTMQWTFIYLILKDFKMNEITNRAVRSEILNSDFIIQRIRLEIYNLSFGLPFYIQSYQSTCICSALNKYVHNLILCAYKICSFNKQLFIKFVQFFPQNF